MSQGAARGLRVVRGRVVDADGRPIEGVELNLFVAGPTGAARTWTRRTTSGADGAFEFAGGDDDCGRLQLDALPRPEHALCSSQARPVDADRPNVIELRPGAGVRVRVLDVSGAVLGGENWRLWLDPTLPGWPPRDRRDEYEARLAALESDPAEFERFAALSGSHGGAVGADGRIAFAGLERGAYWVQLSRVFPERRRAVPSVVAVESGDAEVVDGALVLHGAAAVVVRATT